MTSGTLQRTLLALGAGALLLWGASSVWSPGVAAGGKGVEATAVTSATAVSPRERGLALESAAEQVRADPAPFEPEAMRDDPEYLSDVVRSAVEGDRLLSLIAHYRSRVLLDQEGRAHYRSMLADPGVLARVREDLSHPPEEQENLRDNTRRLMAIDFLSDALAWEENPARERILTSIEALILEDNFREGLGMDMRISIAGNKMELFTLLHGHAPDRASEIVERARGTRLQKLLAVMSDQLRARAQRESAAVLVP